MSFGVALAQNTFKVHVLNFSGTNEMRNKRNVVFAPVYSVMYIFVLSKEAAYYSDFFCFASDDNKLTRN